MSLRKAVRQDTQHAHHPGQRSSGTEPSADRSVEEPALSSAQATPPMLFPLQRMNSYFQYLAGEATPRWGQPCTASDLVHGKAIARQWGMRRYQHYRLVVHLCHAQQNSQIPKRAQQARQALIGDSSNRRSSEKRPQIGRNYLNGFVEGRRNALLERIGFNLILLLRAIVGYFLAGMFWEIFSLLPSSKLRFAQNCAPSCEEFLRPD